MSQRGSLRAHAFRTLKRTPNIETGLFPPVVAFNPMG